VSWAELCSISSRDLACFVLGVLLMYALLPID